MDKSEKKSLSEAEARAKLTPMQYHVTQEKGTERAFTGEYWDHHEHGAYHCICCGAELFSSSAKYESGSGWPSFHSAADPASIKTEEDNSLGMRRVEIMCQACGAHLGHLFPDGPRPTGQRFCVNSASLDFKPAPGLKP